VKLKIIIVFFLLSLLGIIYYLVWRNEKLNNELKQRNDSIYFLKIDCHVRDSVISKMQRWNDVLMNESKDSISSYIKHEKIKRLKNE